MEMIAVVTGLLLLEYFGFVVLVGKARHETGIQAPAMTGSPKLERALRVQMNTLEQLILVLPSMWLFGRFLNPQWGAILGLVFAVGRILYAVGYLRDPGKRGAGFLIGMLATMAMLAGALYGAVAAALQ